MDANDKQKRNKKVSRKKRMLRIDDNKKKIRKKREEFERVEKKMYLINPQFHIHHADWHRLKIQIGDRRMQADPIHINYI